MANKTVLDFPEITSPEDTDVLYAIRGASTGRDKRITWANLKQFLAPITHLATTATASILGHVRLDDAPTRNSTNGVSSDGIWTALYNEAAERQGVDGDLEASIAQEALARSSADSGLSTAISDEASARESGDSGLQSQVNAASAQITKLWGPTSSIEMGFDPSSSNLNIIPATQSIDGRCITVYALSAGRLDLFLDRPAPSTKVFYLRLKLPAYTAQTLGFTQGLQIYFNSALDNDSEIRVLYTQQVATGGTGVSQYSPIFTFVNNGENKWLMF